MWGKIMEQAIGVLKNEKISSLVLVFLCIIAYKGFLWASDEHKDLVQRSEFNELKTLLVDHTEEFRITSASQIIRDIKMEIIVCRAAASSNCSAIEEKLKQAQAYKACLVARKPNCEHLKEVG